MCVCVYACEILQSDAEIAGGWVGASSCNTINTLFSRKNGGRIILRKLIGQLKKNYRDDL